MLPCCSWERGCRAPCGRHGRVYRWPEPAPKMAAGCVASWAVGCMIHGRAGQPGQPRCTVYMLSKSAVVRPWRGSGGRNAACAALAAHQGASSRTIRPRYLLARCKAGRRQQPSIWKHLGHARRPAPDAPVQPGQQRMQPHMQRVQPQWQLGSSSCWPPCRSLPARLPPPPPPPPPPLPVCGCPWVAPADDAQQLLAVHAPAYAVGMQPHVRLLIAQPSSHIRGLARLR